jgi:hypothetical protein
MNRGRGIKEIDLNQERVDFVRKHGNIVVAIMLNDLDKCVISCWLSFLA